MTETLKQIVLAERPAGFPTDANFRLEEQPLPTPGEGEVLVAVKYMSLDPYMRGRMDDGPSYAAPVPVGGRMEAGAVGEVIASNHPKFAVGDHAFGMFGWTTHGVMSGDMLRKVNPDQAPIQTSLGVLGMPGFTAWAGMTAYSKMKAGETLVVGAATGPVGSMVGQLAKQAGLRVIGVAGGEEKCKMATETFGFDACIDHRGKDAKAMREALKAECPDGIDIYFDNVGGDILDAVLAQINYRSTIIVCGAISQYGDWHAAKGPKNYISLITHSAKMQGFTMKDYFHRIPEAVEALLEAKSKGTLIFREHVVEGIENFPEAFEMLFSGAKQGKLLIKVR